MCHNNMSRMFVTLMMVIVLAACHDDGDEARMPNLATWTIEMGISSCADDEGNIVFSRYAAYESITLKLAGYDSHRDSTVAIRTDADWLTVTDDSLAADGTLIINLKTTTNNTERLRTATLTLQATSGSPACQADLSVSQLSSADNDNNGEDARSVLYIGYGYNIYAALNDPMAVRTKKRILEAERIDDYAFNFETLHKSRLSDTRVEYYTASTIQEMASTLSEAGCNSDADIVGCVETCKRAASVSNISLNESDYGYGVFTKTVASRVLDRGAIKFLRNRDDKTGSIRLPFSSELYQDLNEIRHATGTKRQQLITQVLLEYGTHMITEADLGGKIDYVFTYKKSEYLELNTNYEEEIKYTLGQLSKNERVAGYKEVSSQKSGSDAIRIWGGSEDSRRLLEENINNLDQTGQLNPEIMQQWMASINYSDNLGSDNNLDVVRFELIPLWDIVPGEFRQEFLDATMQLSQRSECSLPASFLGTDIYEFNVAEWDNLLDFSKATDDSTLCRLLYMDYNPQSNDAVTGAITDASGTPVLQVCSEYIPKIRTDKRVTVVYPIYQQHIRLNQGLFIGDDVYPPAKVGFHDDDSYVSFIRDSKIGQHLKTFYYVNGNLSLKNPVSFGGLKGHNPKVVSDYFYYIYNKLYSHPIVKIGSNFWTRHDINHLMGFTHNPSSRHNLSDDQLKNDVLYARFYYDIGYYEQRYNTWQWGYTPNTFYEGKPNLKWYFPQPIEVESLYNYLNFNPKALFLGQQSGFNAQFNGYYGIHDILNDTSFDSNNAIRYQGEYCFIASRNSNGEKSYIISLNSDYRIELLPVYSMCPNDYYPIRPVRGWMYNYLMLSDIIKETEF